jgi:hypothetical protein
MSAHAMTKAAVATRVLPLLAAVVLSAGSSTYSTRRAALVPEIAPPMRSGAPMETIGEVSVNLPQAVSTGDPTIVDGQEPGLELPRWQVGGAGRLRLSKSFDMGLVYEQASSNDSRALAEDQPKVDGGDAYGYGLSFMGTAKMSDTMRMAFIGEFLTYSIPYVEYRTCVDLCEGQPLTEVDRGRTNIPVITIGVVPSWHQSSWTLFGGVTARNQPTIERGGIEVGNDGSDVTGGRLNIMLNAGAEVALGDDGLKAMAMVYKSFDASPVDYAPTLAVALSFGFGKPEQPPPAPSYYAPAPAPAAPAATERVVPSAER